MDREEIASTLRRFAEERLNAAEYSDCSHRFELFTCGECGGVELSLAVERHPGDQKGDFKGILWQRCEACGRRGVAFGVTRVGPPPELSQLEQPVCDCGGRVFVVGMCERWEDWGFFDEGTVVARCAACGGLRFIVDTD
jgi:hypothetical protein